jgi:hypothetical protein
LGLGTTENESKVGLVPRPRSHVATPASPHAFGGVQGCRDLSGTFDLMADGPALEGLRKSAALRREKAAELCRSFSWIYGTISTIAKFHRSVIGPVAPS